MRWFRRGSADNQVVLDPARQQALIHDIRQRFTPSARTPDEHPLLKRDFDAAGEIFAKVELHHFGLATVLSVPFRKSRQLGPQMFRATAALDRWLLRTPLRFQSWYALAILTR